MLSPDVPEFIPREYQDLRREQSLKEQSGSVQASAAVTEQGNIARDSFSQSSDTKPRSAGYTTNLRSYLHRACKEHVAGSTYSKPEVLSSVEEVDRHALHRKSKNVEKQLSTSDTRQQQQQQSVRQKEASIETRKEHGGHRGKNSQSKKLQNFKQGSWKGGGGGPPLHGENLDSKQNIHSNTEPQISNQFTPYLSYGKILKKGKGTYTRPTNDRKNNRRVRSPDFCYQSEEQWPSLNSNHDFHASKNGDLNRDGNRESIPEEKPCHFETKSIQKRNASDNRLVKTKENQDAQGFWHDREKPLETDKRYSHDANVWKQNVAKKERISDRNVDIDGFCRPELKGKGDKNGQKVLMNRENLNSYKETVQEVKPCKSHSNVKAEDSLQWHVKESKKKLSKTVEAQPETSHRTSFGRNNTHKNEPVEGKVPKSDFKKHNTQEKGLKPEYSSERNRYNTRSSQNNDMAFANRKPNAKHKSTSDRKHSTECQDNVKGKGSLDVNNASVRSKRPLPSNTSAREKDGIGKKEKSDKPGQKTENSSVYREAARRHRALRKIRSKEEKMRRREREIREAEEIMKSDSKLTVITQAFLESAVASSSRQPQKSNSDIATNTFSIDNYPLLNRSRGPVTRSQSLRKQIESEHSSKSVKDNDDQSNRRPLSKQNTKDVKMTASQNIATTSAALPNYRKALLASESHTSIRTSSPEKVRGIVPVDMTVVIPEKKKVKTSDRIEVDLFAAAKRGEKFKKKKVKESLSDSFEGEADSSSHGYFARGGAASKHRPEVTAVVRRGKQREGAQKKKLSTLKKNIKRARKQEAETLLLVLREAKKIHEALNASRSPEDPPAINKTSSDAYVERSHDDAEFVGKENDDIATERERKSSREKLTEKNNDKAESTESSVIQASFEDDKRIMNESFAGNAVATVAESRSTLADDMNTTENKSNVKNPAEDSTKTSESGIGPVVESSMVNIIAKEVSMVLGSENGFKCEDPEFSKNYLKIVEEIQDRQHPFHKNSFREYCNHVITPEVDCAARELIGMLVRFQERHFQRDPIRAKMRRRYVCGMKETNKLMGKMSCVIVAPNIQRCKGPGALDEMVEKLLNNARKNGVPVIFALTARRLGKLCLKKANVSCIGIINYEGAQVKFQQLMHLVPEAEEKYRELVNRGTHQPPSLEEETSDNEREGTENDTKSELLAVAGVATILKTLEE